MEFTIGLAFIIASLVVIVHFGTKILDWFAKKRYEQYRDNSSEQISDLYRLKIKWAKRGEHLFCQAIEKIIGAVIISEQEEEVRIPQTAEGRSYMEGIQHIVTDEAKRMGKELDEII